MSELIIKKSQVLGPAHLASTLKTLEKNQKQINPVQQKTKDYSIKFSKLNKSQESKLFEEIQKLDIPRISKEHIAEIISLLPKDVNELKTIFAGSKTTVTTENLDKILKALKQYEK